MEDPSLSSAQGTVVWILLTLPCNMEGIHCSGVLGRSGSLQGSICSRGLIPAPASSPSKHIITQLDSNPGGWRIQVLAACSEGRRKRVDFAAYEAWLLCKTVS